MQKVKKIIVYPIKSLGGIEVESALAIVKGFKNDRRWMLVDSQGKFQTQRELSKLALFKTRFEKRGIVVSHNGQEILVQFGLNSKIVRDVNVFEHELKTQEVSSEINNWFSNQLDKKVQLVTMTDISDRVKSFKKPPYKTFVSLADGYPYLILGTASLDNLNSKLDQPIKHDRFRTNIYLETTDPHSEDDLESIQIGGAQFKVVKACARCNVTTINQQTSEVGKEPLKTLATYRKIDHKIYFGANMILEKSGLVSLGDSVISI
ncbi:MOSC domain-containing protein [bacterium]|nr:MOSC domain-containing protein [bacterium]